MISFSTNNTTFSHNKRETAKAALNTLPYPTTKWEEWKFTSLQSILEKTYKEPNIHVSNNLSMCCIPNSDAHTLVFVNGKFHSACLNSEKKENFTLKTWQELTEEHKKEIANYFCANIKAEKDIFTAWNTAYFEEGIYLHVPKNTIVETPIHIQHLTDSEENIAFQHRNLVIVEKGASVKVIETQHGTAKANTLRNAITEIFVAENANAEYIKIQDEKDKASHIETAVLTQKADSKATLFAISLSGEIVRNNLTVNLEGQNIESNLYGSYLLSGSQHIDNHTEVHHKEPHCYSNELYKGIIRDTATGVFNGKIHVYPDAQKTNAYQSNRNILLSDGANIYTKPQLEIYADDVKCSHGATTGQMNEEAMFYLQARGISKENAKNLLINAFAAEITEHISVEYVREYVEELIEKRF